MKVLRWIFSRDNWFKVLVLILLPVGVVINYRTSHSNRISQQTHVLKRPCSDLPVPQRLL